MGVSHMIKRVTWLKRYSKQFSTNTSSVKVELLSEKIIKPSSPTPKNLRHYKLSYNDQILSNQYMPITLFYPNSSTSALSSTLEKSLAKVLSFYYPYAGELVHNSHVDCNDKGVLFKEVHVKGSMSETLTKDFSEVQEILFPGHALPWTQPSEDATLAVAQLTHFGCKGIAISLCLSHKLSDGYAICKFCSDWAELARNSISLANPPSLTGSSLLKPKDDPFMPSIIFVGDNQHLSVVRSRFSPANIKRLKALVSSESHVKDPTRFEVVAAVVNRHATTAARSFDPFTIGIPMNLRNLVNVPNLLGNFDSLILVDVSSEGDLKLPKLVSKIREKKMEHLGKYLGKNKDEVLDGLVDEEKQVQNVSNLRLTSSFCGYPMYNIDFGWGKLARVTIGTIRTENCFVLLDAPEKGGVDVIGALDQSVALEFSTHKDLLEFAELDLSY